MTRSQRIWIGVLAALAAVGVVAGALASRAQAEAHQADIAAVVGAWEAPGLVGHDGTPPRLEFREDGWIGGYDGCNGMGSAADGGSWSTDGRIVRWRELISTAMACVGDHDEMAAFGTHARIEDDELVLLDDGESEVGRLVRAG